MSMIDDITNFLEKISDEILCDGLNCPYCESGNHPSTVHAKEAKAMLFKLKLKGMYFGQKFKVKE